MTSLVGTTIGHYALVEHLGRGGMADVYRAEHTQLGVSRAVKVIRPEIATTDDFQARFQREAKSVAQLEHPNIIRVYDFGIHDNQYYMVVQYIDGQDLRQVLNRDGPMAPERAVEIVIKVARALQAAHRHQLIHRDVKPDNIMIDSDGDPILMDFGIAKLVGDNASLTQTGTGIGTPAYMAPEQAQGQHVTGSADLYALCIVLFEIITGAQPYRAETPIASMMKAISEPLPSPRSLVPAVSVAVENAILRGTAKLPEERHADAAALIADLEGTQTEGDDTLRIERPRARRQNTFLNVSGIEILVLAAAGIIVAIFVGMGLSFGWF